MKTARVCSVVLVSHLMACSRAPAPPDDDLVAAVAALHVLEAREITMQDVSPALKDSILAHYGFTRASLQERVSALAEHPPLGDTLYARVERVLNAASR